MAFHLNDVDEMEFGHGFYDGELYMLCPYNKEHVILGSRMQFHVARCRVNYDHLPKKMCPFDSTHLIPEPEHDFHLTVCPKRGNFDQFRYRENMPLVVVPPPIQPAPEVDEFWDEIPELEQGPGYDPLAIAVDRNIILRPHGAQPAQRRNFRMEQRRRFNNNYPPVEPEPLPIKPSGPKRR